MKIMMNFFKDGRGMAYGQSDEVTKLPSDKPSCPINNKNIRYSVQNSGEASAPSVYKLVLFLVVCLFTDAALAQSHSPSEAAAEAVSPLMVGQKVPESFWKQEHLFYINGDTIRKTLEEHKGKMLVLGFWATWCSSCLAHQADIDNYVNRYPDRLAVVKVNSTKTKDNVSSIEKVISGRIGEENELSLNNFSTIITDTYLQDVFPHYAYPYYVWINTKGIVQITTFRNLLNEEFRAPYIDRS